MGIFAVTLAQIIRREERSGPLEAWREEMRGRKFDSLPGLTSAWAGGTPSRVSPEGRADSRSSSDSEESALVRV